MKRNSVRFWNALKSVGVKLGSKVSYLFRRRKNEVVYDICCENPEEAMFRNAMLSIKTGKAVVGKVSRDGKKLTSKVLD